MVKIMSGFLDSSNIGNYHLWAKNEKSGSKDYWGMIILYQILFSRIDVLNPLLATIDVVSNSINIWFLGLETFIFILIPVILLIKSEYLLPPS